MVRMLQNYVRKLVLVAGFVAFNCLVLTGTANAANVYNCTPNGYKCVIKVEAGIVGDKVKVLDEKARLIAEGQITKRKGAYAVVSLTYFLKTIRRGYPVIVDIENRSADMQWTASFSN